VPRKKRFKSYRKTSFLKRKLSWFAKNKGKERKRADFMLLFIVFILSVFGLIMVYDASIVDANDSFGDQFYFVKFQGAYLFIGFILLIIAGHIDYHIYKKFIKYLFAANVFLLILVLTPLAGNEIYGARRWIDLGPITFQPTEPFKTVLAIYLATWMEKKRTLLQFFVLIGFVLSLVILEPDMGTSIVLITSAFLVYYISGANTLKFALSSFMAFLGGLLLILLSPYRRQRLTTFFDPQSDPLGSSYHIQQILMALGSGGFFGLGVGQSLQKYQYLPEATSDSIFAIVGEEVGFVGSTVLILLFMAVIWKGFQIAQKAPDLYGRLLATGITGWIGTQVFVNLASMVSLAPLTGIPLPLFSYGGTSLVVTLISIGILLNISKQKSLN
jgi:cell division protein FtsW